MLSLIRTRGCWSAATAAIPLLLLLLLLLLQVELSRASTCHIQLDMVVAVDTSSSCSETEFQQLLLEVKGLVSGFSVGQGKVRLALIGMSQIVQSYANFNDGLLTESLTDFNSAVDRLKLIPGHTDISKGMKLARETVLSTARSAPTGRILILVKDRRCDDFASRNKSTLSSIAAEAEALWSASVNCSIHAVGIGDLWSLDELNSIFGPSYLLFKSRNKAMDSLKSLNNKVCPPKCKQSEHFRTGTCYGNARQVMTVVDSTGAGSCRQKIARLFFSCTEKQSCSSIDRSVGSCDAGRNVVVVSEQWKFFNRKSQSCDTHVEKHEVSCVQAIECKRQVADVFLLLDQSDSLREKFGSLVDAAVVLIESLHIGASNVHIGVGSYSEYISVSVHLGKEFDKTQIVRMVNNMKNAKDFYRTNTGSALREIESTFESSGRLGVTKAIIIITDGRSSDREVTFRTAESLKRSGVTIYVIGVRPLPESGMLDIDELKMLASPEVDKNLFILETFEDLASWAKQFSNKLCIELAPVNPILCDADVQYKSISTCLFNQTTRERTMQTAVITYKYDAEKKCIKQFKTSLIPECKSVCVDPVDGSEHLEGESWTNMCHDFHCNKGGKPTLPTKTTKCLAADFSCMSIGSAAFQCRNIDGEVRENCQCIGINGVAVLVINNSN